MKKQKPIEIVVHMRKPNSYPLFAHTEIPSKLEYLLGKAGKRVYYTKRSARKGKKRYEAIERGNMAARKFDLNDIYSDNEIIKILRSEGYYIIGLVGILTVLHCGIPVGDKVRLMFEKNGDGMYKPYFEPLIKYKIIGV